MSADELHTRFEQDRQEMITRAETLRRLVQIQDEQFQAKKRDERIEEMLRKLLAWARVDTGGGQ